MAKENDKKLGMRRAIVRRPAGKAGATVSIDTFQQPEGLSAGQFPHRPREL